MLTVGHQLTGRELLDLQKRAGRHLSFSVTQACPLTCAHCMVGTVLPHQKARVTLDLAGASRFAAEFAALRDQGIERISFTGGEPLLAIDVLRVLSEAATAAGIECAVVTACFWATTPAAAINTVRTLSAVQRWHLSADRYHQVHVPIGFVIRAAEAVVAERREALVRMAVPLPVQEDDRTFYEQVRGALPADVPIAVQRVSRVGRAEALDDVTVPAAHGGPGLCLSTGPLVRHDGTVAPCCSSLGDAREGHPYRYPNARELGLTAVYDAWHADPLLQLTRAVGFGPVLQHLAGKLPDHPVLSALPEHPCDLCVAIWREPQAVAEARRWADSPVCRAKVAEVVHAVFDAPLGAETEFPSPSGGPCDH